RRHLVGRVMRKLTGPSLVTPGLIGLAVTFGLLNWRSRSLVAPAESRQPSAPATDPAGGTAVPAKPTAVLGVASATRPGVIRLIGQRAIEGPNRQAGGWGTDTWALLGLLAEHRSSLLTKAIACDKLWPEAEAQHDRFAGLLKATRAKMCDALGMPGTYGRVVIQFKGGAGYRINPDLYVCDVWQLRDLLAAAAVATGPEKIAALTAAVDLYAGSYLPVVPRAWARQTADVLNRGIVQALAELA